MCFDYTHGRKEEKPSAAGKRQSLPKPYTNNDMLNDMSIEQRTKEKE